MTEPKQIKDMTRKELEDEYNGVCEHIDLMSYGNYELRYRSALEQEIAKRGLDIASKTTYKLVK